MRIYLDNCALNRPFDDKEQLTVEMEAVAKLQIQGDIRDGTYDKADHFDYTKWQSDLWKDKTIDEIHQEATAFYNATH